MEWTKDIDIGEDLPMLRTYLTGTKSDKKSQHCEFIRISNEKVIGNNILDHNCSDVSYNGLLDQNLQNRRLKDNFGSTSSSLASDESLPSSLRKSNSNSSDSELFNTPSPSVNVDGIQFPLNNDNVTQESCRISPSATSEEQRNIQKDATINLLEREQMETECDFPSKENTESMFVYYDPKDKDNIEEADNKMDCTCSFDRTDSNDLIEDMASASEAQILAAQSSINCGQIAKDDEEDSGHEQPHKVNKT